MSSLLIFGAGGHGKVIAETARETSRWNNIVLVDDLFPKLTKAGEFSVIGTFQDGLKMQLEYPFAVVAVGENSLRLGLSVELSSLRFKLPVIRHPSAVVSNSASIGDGSVLLANSVVQSSTVLGKAVILNTSSSVDHDCRIGNGVHLAPGTHVGGDVNIGMNTFLGVGVSVIRGIKIGENSIIGGGAAVIANIASNIVAVGVPARKIGNNE